jgi:general secretion pathway protein A
MYLSFYRLREFPFTISCDEKFFYESIVHTEALGNMMYTVQQRKGMVLVTGEVGAGKTFVGNMLGTRLGVGCQIVMMRHPPQSSKQLLRSLASGIGMNVRPNSDKLYLTEAVEEQLIRLNQRGRLVAVIIDEAQNLTTAALEEIRLLWNWEQHGQRLVQIILIGQPEFRQRLLEPKWEPLRQRIVLSYHLNRLGAADSADYIRHRVKVAAEEGCQLSFTPEAMADIYAATDGIPRLINVLCDNALLVGYANGVQTIFGEIIADVLRDMTCWGLKGIAPTPSRPSKTT